MMTTRRRCKRVMTFAAKGGMGKTTLATNLLVAAAQDGMHAVGVDFDGQRHLAKWFGDREKHPAYAQMAQFSVGDVPLHEWPAVLEQVSDHDVAVFDMPPGIEGDTANILSALAPKMDIILIPTPPEAPSYDMVKDFVATFRASGSQAFWVLNRVVKGRTSIREARSEMEPYGPICPVEVSMRDEVWRAFKAGCAASEIMDTQSGNEFRAIWTFVKEKLQ